VQKSLGDVGSWDFETLPRTIAVGGLVYGGIVGSGPPVSWRLFAAVYVGIQYPRGRLWGGFETGGELLADPGREGVTMAVYAVGK
jgi:hypothetical protein